MKQKHVLRHILIIVVILAMFAVFAVKEGLIPVTWDFEATPHEPDVPEPDILAEAGEWKGFSFTYINNNVPGFTKDEIRTTAQEWLAQLDELGRAGSAVACIGQETMPSGERETGISEIKPSGWRTDRYDFVSGDMLYNRCHLIAYQLTGDEAIDRNLITGTSYLNREGMVPFENAVGVYCKQTGNHVMYRVTPVYWGNELVARGVHIEALSVEDSGKGISFNVFCYNVQPGVEINYLNGKSKAREDDELLPVWQEGGLWVYPKLNSKASPSDLKCLEVKDEDRQDYLVNISTGKFHRDGCTSLYGARSTNIRKLHTSREDLIVRGYEPCGRCDP